MDAHSLCKSYLQPDRAGRPLPAARAALVTPLRDGMNLVAKEFVAAQDADDPGVLILSRFAGAAAGFHAACWSIPTILKRSVRPSSAH